MIEEIEEDFPCVLPQINEADVALNSLPAKSRRIYEKAYKEFSNWCLTQNIVNFSENDLLEYFSEKSKRFKSSTLWSNYSMLKSTMAAKDSIDIGKFTKVLTFLKIQGKGYKPTQTKVLTQEQINKFLVEAPDYSFLMAKVLLIFGVAGALRREELTNLSMSDLHDLGSAILVTIKNTKPNENKIFTVTNVQENGVDSIGLCRKYIELRSPIKEHERLFVNYKNGKCFVQPVGKNMFGKIPKRIAYFLKLPDASLYTGHCFRSSSASLYKRCRGPRKVTSVLDDKISQILTNRRKSFVHHSNESEQPISFDSTEEMDTMSNEDSNQTFIQLSESIRIKEETEETNVDFDECSNSRSTDEKDTIIPQQLVIKEEEEDPLLPLNHENSKEAFINQNSNISRTKDISNSPPSLKENEIVENQIRANFSSDDLILINESNSDKIIFSSRNNINTLCNLKKILIDRTFTCGFSELVTIKGIESNHHVPLLFTLLQKKDENSYYQLLKQIAEISFKKYSKILEPKEIKLDCDKNLHGAVLKMWPKVKIIISPLQLHETWLKKIREFNLEEDYNDESSKIGVWLKSIFKLTKMSVDQFNTKFEQELESCRPCDERIVKYVDYLFKTFIRKDSDFPPILWAK